MATATDDNAADEKSDKSIWQLLNIRCTRNAPRKEILMDNAGKNVIEVKGVSIEFPGVKALQNVSCKFESGMACLLYTSPSPRDCS